MAVSYRMESSLRVLVAEDDPGIIKLITFLLRKNYYRVEVTSYEVELMSLIEKRRPSIIVMNIALENMDTIDVITKLKEEERTQEIPVLCVSGKGNELKLMRALQEGADAYIVQPFTPKELLDKIVASLKKGE